MPDHTQSKKTEELLPALENLRWCMWGVASMQTNSHKMFDNAEFTPLIWTREHGCKPQEWRLYVEAANEEQEGVGYKRCYDRSPKMAAILKHRSKIRTMRAILFYEIMERLKQEWIEKVAARRPEITKTTP